jgi:hypothetical protein
MRSTSSRPGYSLGTITIDHEEETVMTGPDAPQQADPGFEHDPERAEAYAESVGTDPSPEEVDTYLEIVGDEPLGEEADADDEP